MHLALERFIVHSTAKKQVLDITDELEEKLKNAPFSSGLLSLFVLHTTCALTTADLDPGTDLDMLDAFEEMIPKLSYRHPHDPSHVGDHIMSSIIGPSVLLPFEKKKLLLGTWQRVVLVELMGPRKREMVLSFLPASP